MRLFRWFILRRLAHERLRSATTALGIALGVAVIVAIQLTNASSLRGFETALNTVSGRTSLEIAGSGLGIDETVIPQLAWLERYGDVSPIIEGDFLLKQDGRPTEALRVLGVDILRDRPFRDYHLIAGRAAARDPRPEEFLALLLDPRSAVLTAKFASKHGIATDSTLLVRVGDRAIPLVVRGLLADEGPARVLDGNFVLMDIAAAQQAFDRFGRVDRLDVRLHDGVAIDAAEAAIARALPPSLSVQRPAQRGRQVENMLAAFHLNLTALSYIALLVGLFLVYNTVSVAVLARRAEIGTLRALGATRARIRALFLAEAAALSVTGSALGLAIGRLLADAAVSLTSTTVSALYIADAASPPSLDWRHVTLAFGAGVPLSMLAAFIPASEATRVPPTAAIHGADQLETRRHLPRRLLWVAALLLALGAWLATLGPVRGLPLFGYGSAVAIVFGASFLVPAVLFVVVRALAAPIRRLLRVEDWLAVTNIAASVPRLSISVAALAVSLSMMAAIAIMIGSFRETVIYWVSQTLQADLFVIPAAGQTPGREQTLSRDVVATITESPDVSAVDRFRAVEMPYGNTTVRVGAGDFDVLLAHASLLFKQPDTRTAREAMRTAIGRDEVVVSESFAIRQHASLGDTVRLQTRTGPAAFRVVAIYYDYTTDRGVIAMDRRTFAAHYGEQPWSSLGVYLKAGVNAEQARDRLLSAIGDAHQVQIRTNPSLRREILRIFDSTFAITWALECIAIVIAILGVSGTLLTLILEREPELTVLRLIGTDRHQVRRMVVGEAALIGAVSQLIGLVVGLALSAVLIYVVNLQSFGWTIQFHLPWAFLVQSTILIVLSTSLAALYPARRAIALTLRRDE